MTKILILKVFVQPEGHFSALEVVIQKALVQVALQVLHVEDLYVVPGKLGHVVDQDLFTRLVRVGFTPHDAI